VGGLAMSPATAAACRAAAAGFSPGRRRSAAASSQAVVVTFASGVRLRPSSALVVHCCLQMWLTGASAAEVEPGHCCQGVGKCGDLTPGAGTSAHFRVADLGHDMLAD
jgi:hypothetical protein